MTDQPFDDSRINDLIERSSLGTPGAQRLRHRTSAAHADAIRQINALRGVITHGSPSQSAQAIADLLALFTRLGYVAQAAQLIASVTGTDPLTEQEALIVTATLAGHSTDEIARMHGLAADTVREHQQDVYRKLGVGDRAGLKGLILGDRGNTDRPSADAGRYVLSPRLSPLTLSVRPAPEHPGRHESASAGETEESSESFAALIAELAAFRDHRLGRQPSDRTLAKAAGVTPTTIHNWLRKAAFPRRIEALLAMVRAVRAEAERTGRAGDPAAIALLDEQRWRNAYAVRASSPRHQMAASISTVRRVVRTSGGLARVDQAITLLRIPSRLDDWDAESMAELLAWEDTREMARQAGLADGENPDNFRIFVSDNYQPEFMKGLARIFEALQSQLLDRRSKALREIERETQVSSLALIKRWRDLRVVSDEINFSRLALEKPSGTGQQAESRGEVRFITPEEAGRERAERRLREIDSEIEARVIKLSVATNTWLETWSYYLEQAKQALEQANVLADHYVEGLLSSHEYAAEIQRRWRRQSFELFPEWFERATPQEVRDSIQAWEEFLELWRQAQLPRSIERGHNDIDHKS